MSKARQLADLGNVYDDGALSNRNLIINGAMQVSQRGTSFTSSGGFSLDRWYVNQNSSTTTYTDASGQKWLDFTNNGVTFANVRQKIEDGLYLIRNKSITLSFDWEEVTAGPAAEVRFFNNVDLNTYVAIPSPSVSERKVITVSIGNVGSGAGGWLGVGFYNTIGTGASGRFRISNVQLEVGDTATPFEHRSYGQELALCQRYYQWNPCGPASFSGASNQAAGSVALPVALRSTPTITVVDGTSAIDELYVTRRDLTATLTIYDDSPSFVPKTSYSVFGSCSAGATANTAAIFMAGHWSLDAEL